MDSTPLLPVAPAETSFVPTTNRIAGAWGKFRILIVGRSGTGKSSLINATFQASLTDVERGGQADINKAFFSPHNKHLIIHDSQGYQDAGTFDVLARFIIEYTRKEPASERLHAIWLCITSPLYGTEIFDALDKKIFESYRYTVPIIVVFTKFDLFVEALERETLGKGRIRLVIADFLFKRKYGEVLEKLAKITACQIPYALVMISQPDSLRKLAEITMQRIVVAQKVAASIMIGKKRYWRTMLSGVHFFHFNLQNYLYAIHKDLVALWNIQNTDEFLSDEFCRRIAFLSDDFTSRGTGNRQDEITRLASIVNALTNGLYQRLPEHIGLLMRFIVDLTIILQAVFQLSFQDQSEGHMTLDGHVNVILYMFLLEKKTSIHNAIREFVEAQHQFVKDSVVDKMESLIKENEMNCSQFDPENLPFRSLFTILKFELSTRGLQYRNRTILGIMTKLLQYQDYADIVAEMSDPLDIEILLDFILYVLHNYDLSNSGIQDANRKIRRLMFEMASEKDVLPRSLFITDVRIEGAISSGAIGIGSFGTVFRGEFRGHHVTLKVLQTTRKANPFRKDFCREALVWKSFLHARILPLLGVFEENSRLYLVSPYIPNGTLAQWRKDQLTPVTAEIHRLMLEVAEGIQYLHSEGMVHGSLKGEDIMLDNDFHCQITNFGSARHIDSIATVSDDLTLISTAPELLGACDKCGQQDCDRCYEDGGGSQLRRRTMQTDVYAFGCLYYAIFFDALPFQGKMDDRIIWLVTNGVRPDRLKSPRMEEETWDLIQRCWTSNPSKRPMMEQIVEILM